MANAEGNLQTSGTLSYCAISAPENFTFRQPENWLKWKTRFMRYRSISGLSNRDEISQIDALLYTMGDCAEDIFAALQLTADEKKSYEAVISKLDNYFLPKKNVIFKRAQFNRRRQESHESVDMFATDLYRLSESCDFGPLREQLIRDRIVVGLLDANLSEKLQLDADLTLETALKKARSSESVKKQQSTLRESENKPSRNMAVEEVRFANNNRKPLRSQLRTDNSQSRYNSRTASHKHTADTPSHSKRPCNWCGQSSPHTKQTCPARDKICSGCHKKGHFVRVCKSRSGTQRSAQLEEVFVGPILQTTDETPWMIDIKVESAILPFKIDTGADVTVISHDQYRHHKFGKLSVPDKALLAPARQRLRTVGFFDARLSALNHASVQRIYVVPNLRQNLLGRPAITALGVLTTPATATVSPISSASPQGNDISTRFPKLFSGLGCLGKEYEYRISLAPDAQPYAITTPRRVPIPLLPLVQAELERMEKLGVITRVEEATEWCAPMVIAWKRDGQIRLCTGFEELNRCVLRERTVMPTVEESLGRLAGATVFSKIDARWGFGKYPCRRNHEG